MSTAQYINGDYLAKNPTWHAEDSPWKAAQIVAMLRKHQIKPSTMCEVGCGAGEVLVQLQHAFPDSQLSGWDISPQAIALAAHRANEQLQFHCGDFFTSTTENWDVLLVLDVLEHVEDYFSFLRGLKDRSDYILFHIPLDLSVQAILRGLLLRWRHEVGHLHYFTRELALEALKETGYQILDSTYTTYAIDRPAATYTAHLARWPRRICYALNPHWTARILGGFCLLVLAQ